MSKSKAVHAVHPATKPNAAKSNVAAAAPKAIANSEILPETTAASSLTDTPNTPTARLILRRGKEESLRRFHPWIFSGAIYRMEGSPAEGDLVDLFTSQGEFIARGHYQIGSITVRVLSFADEAIVVTLADPASQRDAARATELLLARREIPVRMAVNRVSPKLFTRMQSTVDDVMDLVGLPLLGLVPEDASVVLAAASGRLLIDFTEQGAAKACHNLAGRLEGRRVPLMKLKK